jgi:hypothetical protein
MKAHLFLSAAFGGIALVALGSSAVAQSASGAARVIAKIDPCKLVTKNEIQTAIETKRKPSELATLKSRGIVWSISTTSATEGESARCRIHWQGNFGSVMQETGDMSVTVYPAEYFTANVADMNRVRQRNGRPNLSPIPGIGDEAHYFGYSETGNPEARVGDVAVGIDRLQGKASLDLLRAAVGRVPRG